AAAVALDTEIGRRLDLQRIEPHQPTVVVGDLGASRARAVLGREEDKSWRQRRSSLEHVEPRRRRRRSRSEPARQAAACVAMKSEAMVLRVVAPHAAPSALEAALLARD